MSEDNKALHLRLYEEIWEQGDLDVIDEIFASDFRGYLPGNPEPIAGLEEQRQFIAFFRSAFPDPQFTIEEQISEGDSVVTRWTFRATHDGAFGDVPATGKEVTVKGMTLSHVVDGKLAVDITYYDELGMLKQIGVIPE